MIRYAHNVSLPALGRGGRKVKEDKWKKKEIEIPKKKQRKQIKRKKEAMEGNTQRQLAKKNQKKKKNERGKIVECLSLKSCGDNAPKAK